MLDAVIATIGADPICDSGLARTGANLDPAAGRDADTLNTPKTPEPPIWRIGDRRSGSSVVERRLQLSGVLPELGGGDIEGQEDRDRQQEQRHRIHSSSPAPVIGG
ncbi:MAG TPA: hypothetical protein VFY18_15400 [Candidatus Limnocylindrales bacterium]|nr:hypothetical protein [Candidatus Limnocylindrales bacterium]